MKNIITLLIGLALVGTAFGQEVKSKELSQAEQFSATSGTLIEKQFIDVGRVKGVDVKVLKLKDLIQGATRSALRLEYAYRSSYGSDTKIASLDSDEIDGLIKSIRTLQSSIFNSTRDSYTEVTFKSRTGFEAGAYFDKSKQKWMTYLQLEQYDSNSTTFLTIDDFSTLLALIEQAKSKM